MTSISAQAKRILVIDDEPDLVELLSYNLGKAGFRVRTVPDGEEALQAIKSETFDLIILDLMLPGLQGNEICRILKRNPKTAALPIIMVTAKGELADRIEGLETGADDYLTKPFSPRELIARIRAVLRRTTDKTPSGAVLRIGSLSIDRERYSVTKGETPVQLSATEYQLLLYLVEHRGKVFSRDQLLDAVWHDESFVEPRTVDVHIRRLRARIEDDPSEPAYIKTRRGVGYYVE